MSAFAAPVASAPAVGTPAAPRKQREVKADRETYRSRDLAGQADIEVLRICRESEMPVILHGPPGAGKTRLVNTAFPEAITINGDGDTITDDFVGSWQPTDEPGRFVWTDGPLVEAMRNGVPLFVDDCTLISPKVMAVLYPVMDGRGFVQVKSHPVPDPANESRYIADKVEATPGFFVIGGHNPGVHGAILTEALASRFAIQIEVTTDFAVAREMRIDPKVIKLAEHLTTLHGNNEVGWRPQMRELLAYQRIKERLSEQAAIANLVGLVPLEDRPVVEKEVTSIYGEKISHLALGKAWSA